MAPAACRRAFLLVLLAGVWSLPAPAQESYSVPQQPSLGDYARSLREKNRTKIKVTPEEAQHIFKAVDDITEFASIDSGMPKKTNVKRRLVGQTEVENLARENTLSDEERQERQRGLLAMKKFGLIPRDFDMESFVVQLLGESIAGFYDPRTKMISLLNWIPLQEQLNVLAHELTHALQDQNYDLMKWQRLRKPPSGGADKSLVNSDTDIGESSTAARCVTEGQAMVVMYDFLLAGMGIDLEHSPGAIEGLQEHMSYGAEGPALHRAPLALREGMKFPYREGLIFEITLLQHGSRRMAFNEAMQHPPRLSHEILQPQAYIAHERIAPVRIPDLRPVLGDSVRVQDTGIIGELDTSVFIHEYESNWLSKELAKSWRGGSYATVARAPAGQPSTTNDIALIYASRWQSPETAERFARFYAAAVEKRYRSAAIVADWKRGDSPSEALASIRILTEEGPVIVEQWPGNMVFVTESFDPATSARVRNAVINATRAAGMSDSNGIRHSSEGLQPVAGGSKDSDGRGEKDADLTLRLAGWPELAPVRNAIHADMINAAIQAAHAVAAGSSKR